MKVFDNHPLQLVMTAVSVYTPTGAVLCFPEQHDLTEWTWLEIQHLCTLVAYFLVGGSYLLSTTIK